MGHFNVPPSFIIKNWQFFPPLQRSALVKPIHEKGLYCQGGQLFFSRGSRGQDIMSSGKWLKPGKNFQKRGPNTIWVSHDTYARLLKLYTR